MEFITKNLINTTTQITIDSATGVVENIMSRNTQKQWVSDGFANDLTSSSLTITFSATTSVSRIALMGCNLKSFDIYYNGSTANTFALTTTAATTVSSFTSNSETSLYMVATTANVSSVTIDMRSTITADAEKAIGYFVLADSKLDFERIPASKNYKPKIDSLEVVHKMSDGGTRISVIDRKYMVDIKYKNITASFRDGLKTVYDDGGDFIFVAFGTMTAWDEVLFPCVWEGDFGFYEYSDDAVDAGFEGSIKLKETTL